MTAKLNLGIICVVLLFAAAGFCQYSTAPVAGAAAGGNAQLAYPGHYREWVYLSSGFDMSYRPAAQTDHHLFDNVFVNPDAYKAFVATGKWPDKTMLVLEVREGEGKGSINAKGNYQGAVVGLEIHVKDEARFPGRWGFYAFENGKTGKLIPTSADCYSCHAAHGAVDTTFVQFYPTLLPIATRKGTLSDSYQKEVDRLAPK